MDLFKKNEKNEIIWMRDIRTDFDAKEAGLLATTPAGKMFEKKLIELDKEFEQIHVSFNLENIEAAVGVTTNCVTGGLRVEEATEICFLSGYKTGKLVAFDLTEYNPFVEDWRTGRLVASLFYYFALGLSKRLQEA